MNDLLICAEVLGYSAEVVGDEVWLYHCNVDTSSNPAPGSNIKILSTVWEPDKCDAQAMELLKHLMETDTTIICKVQNGKYVIGMQVTFEQVTGQTLNEAIVNACVEMMKNE